MTYATPLIPPPVKERKPVCKQKPQSFHGSGIQISNTKCCLSVWGVTYTHQSFAGYFEIKHATRGAYTDASIHYTLCVSTLYTQVTDLLRVHP